MPRTKAASSRVGIRELRQNLSVYLARVREGEALEVTDRGTAVALLIPLPEAATALETLIAMGRATPPEGDLLELELPDEEASRKLSEALEAEREERL